jgi:stalled ribosome rescue protein Dom34
MMPHHYHAIAWIDHREARIFHFNASEMDLLVLQPENPTHHLHHKANSIGSGNSAEDHDFFQHVAEAVMDAGELLIVGPANAKTELAKYIKQHIPALSEKIAAVETVDHPSDGELVAMARKYFKVDHQMSARIQ